jgi:RHS repeat-associated protein
MYSVQNVRSRFTADPVPNNAADHLVAVRYDATASAWQYNVGSGVNSGWRNFVPTSTDRLLGEMNSATQTASTFRGQSTVIFGINAGYAVGDLDIEAFRYNGAASSGNLSVTGTHFATRAGTTAYTWDTRGRLTGATTIDTSSRTIAQTTYQYDVLDRRIGRTENSEGVIVDRDRYLYQGEHVAAVASDSDGDGNYRITDRYLHSMATDAVLSMVSSVEATGASVNAPTTASLASADLLWMLTDHLGSVRDVVSAGGNIVRQHINYDAFGNRVGEVHRSSTGALINGDSAAAVDALFGYAGREWDDSIDLQYNRARWYDPATGRFISQDPIGFEAGDANLYRYVGNGVMTKTDPSGLLTPTYNPVTAIEQATQKIKQLFTLWENTSHMGPIERGYVVGGTMIADMVGVRGVSDACSDHDAVDGHLQGLKERILDGVLGSVQLVGTATGVYGGVSQITVIVRGPLAAGKLTAKELKELQKIADEFDTEIHIVGSRASGQGRNIDTDFPVGKQPRESTRSDIDCRIDGSHPQSGEIAKRVNATETANVDPTKHDYSSRPTYPPSIIVRPRRRPQVNEPNE